LRLLAHGTQQELGWHVEEMMLRLGPSMTESSPPVEVSLPVQQCAYGKCQDPGSGRVVGNPESNLPDIPTCPD
jgi:hypothetical protein